jgi:drug/metabolite transporter (DMT)-like permease
MIKSFEALPANGKKLVAFIAMAVIMSAISLITKVSQKNGASYTFNPASAIAIAEMIKLSLSLSSYLKDNTIATAKASLERPLVTVYFILAVIYMINNQLTFYMLTLTDPGTVALFKASSPFTTALLEYLVYSKKINELKWVCIILTCLGLILTQWNDCTSSLRASTKACAALIFSVLLTSFSSVMNANVIKGMANVPLTLQNSVLYSFGSVLNVMAFIAGANGLAPAISNAGFFEGYNDFWALMVVMVNSFIGIVITAVYKYGDAIVKTLASAVSAMSLVIISAMFFDGAITVSSSLGCMVAFIASYVYFGISNRFDETKEAEKSRDLEMASKEEVKPLK